MPSQLLPNQVAIPKFREIVLYTGNVMLTTTTASKFWNKKSNTEVNKRYSLIDSVCKRYLYVCL